MGDVTAQGQVRQYFREVSERCKLPPLPAVVTTALKLIRGSDGDTRKLCRVLCDDMALAGRILSISRSAFYARYSPPRTLQEAIQVLGLRTVRQVLVTATAQNLCSGHRRVSEALWNHSLATALAAQTLAQQAGFQEPDQAFLGGLLHDIGHVVLLHADPTGFGEIYQRAHTHEESVIPWEKEVYGFDHTLIGVALLDVWDFDSELGSALLSHHEDVTEGKPASLGSLLRVADYITCTVGLGFLSELPPPPPTMLRFFGGETEEALGQLGDQVRQAFEAEKALFA